MSKGQNIAPGFTAPDKAKDPSYFTEFLKAADALEDVPLIRQTMRRFMNIMPGQTLLDVGCGIGSEVKALCDLVGSNGSVHGIDVGEIMIETASRLHGASNAKFALGDIHQLSFADNTFDASRSERVFMYLKDPERALNELVRVTKPGGRVAIYDFEWDCFYATSPDITLTRRLHRLIAESIPNGHIGSKLVALFESAGLRELKFEPVLMRFPYRFYQNALSGLVGDTIKSGLVTEAEITTWWRGLEETDSAGCFYSGMQGFVVAGTVD